MLKRPRLGLGPKIIAWSFVPTVVILFAVALVNFYAYQNVTQDLVIGRNQELARLSASQLSSEVSGFASVLSNLALTGPFREADEASQAAALSQYKDRLAVFDAGVVALDNHGVVIASYPDRQEIQGQDWSTRPYFVRLLRSAGYIFSDVAEDGPQGASVVIAVVPVLGETGEMEGALLGMFRLKASALSSLYGGIVKLRIGQAGNTTVVDSGGRVVYHDDFDLIGLDLSSRPEYARLLEQRALDQDSGYASTGEGLATYSTIPGTPWYLITEESWAQLQEPGQGYQRFLLILLALGIIVPALVVTLSVSRITGPIAQLIRGAKQVATGNFGSSIRVSTGDELEELATQFNVMSTKLEESYANLEKRVADRTRELAALNAISAVVNRTLEVDEIMNSALDKTMEVTQVDIGGAYYQQEAGTGFRLAAQNGGGENLSRELELLWTASTPSDMDWTNPHVAVQQIGPEYAEAEESGQRPPVTLVVTVPLTSKGNTLGVLKLGTRGQRAFSNEEMSLLAAIGQQVGMALENARHHQTAEQLAVASERSRLARDLHDAVTQTLFSASLMAEVLPKLWKRNPVEAEKRLHELRQLTRGALAEMRTLLVELRPAALVETPLPDLLRQLAESSAGRGRINVDVVLEGEPRPIPPDVQVAIYRVVQESLNNVTKHSGASAARIELRYDPTGVNLKVVDNGRGFASSEVPADHFGLRIMRDRAEAIGAACEITTSTGEGTTISLRWSEPDAAGQT